MTTPALELRGITKRFGNVVALDDANLVVRTGSVHAVLGENGAGKSTLMRIAVGLSAADAGVVSVDGAVKRWASIRDSARARIGMVHQHLSLAPSLTAAETVALGGGALYRPAAIATQLKQVMEAAGLDVPLNVPVSELSLAHRQRLEILKALVADARILILDEPTAVLAPAEVRDLLAWVRRFASAGGSVVIVTHKLREALSVSDDITVLRRGRVTLATPASGTNEADLARAIFPEAPEPVTVSPVPSGEEIVVLDRVTVADARGVRRLKDATVRARRHEIVGIAAVEASGHHELLATLGGFRTATSGTVQLPPRGVVIPADRHRDGIVLSMSLIENVALRGSGGARGRLPWERIRERTESLISRFHIAAPAATVAAGALSGGNQQRLVIGAALEHDVDVVVANNPTRGLDLSATAFVHEQLRHAAERGAAVFVYSTDLDEVLSLATRMLVVFQGTVREAPLDRERVGAMMLGSA